MKEKLKRNKLHILLLFIITIMRLSISAQVNIEKFRYKPFKCDSIYTQKNTVRANQLHIGIKGEEKIMINQKIYYPFIFSINNEDVVGYIRFDSNKLFFLSKYYLDNDVEDKARKEQIVFDFDRPYRSLKLLYFGILDNVNLRFSGNLYYDKKLKDTIYIYTVLYDRKKSSEYFGIDKLLFSKENGITELRFSNNYSYPNYDIPKCICDSIDFR